MKAISIRFNGYQSDWLKTEAKIRNMPVADYVRELIESQMKEAHFFEYFKAAEKSLPMPEKQHLIYGLMSYKLLEQLVLNEDSGAEKRDKAYSDTLAWLDALKVYSTRTKNYRITLLLHPPQLAWVQAQAKILKKSIPVIIRKIVALASKEVAQNTTALTDVQKEELKVVLMTFTLLKCYITEAYDEGEALVKNCSESAKALYSQLYADV